MILSFEDICLGFSAQTVLDHVSGVIHEGRRIGLVGANGAGKTTLLNILAGKQDYEMGSLSVGKEVQIGYLQQNTGLDRTGTIQSEMLSVFSHLLELENELHALRHDMSLKEEASDEYHRLAALYSQKQEQFEHLDGYNIEVKINTILNGMGFMNYDRTVQIDALSGGEKTRLALAKLLLINPDLLILDEPTNHLDFRTLGWLEEYLESYKGALLVVSHDRYFLNKLVGEIWEIENCSLSSYKGNYSQYVTLKKERIQRQLKEYEIQQQQIASMEDYVQRNIARASTSKSAKSRVAALERMERIEKPGLWEKRARFQFVYDKPPVKDVLHVQDMHVAVGEGETKKELFSHLNFDLLRGEKIAFIGPNGAGKSSFLKAILGLIPSDYAQCEWGRGVQTAYYEQENRLLHPEKRVIDQLWDRYPTRYEQEMRDALGRVLFSGEDVFKTIETLSGGEKARLAFAALMLEKGNVLILDEPTNHLDIASKEMLDDALKEFDGTLVMVSHDRYLLNKIPSKIIEMNADGLAIYPGNYDYYLENRREPVQAAKKEKTPTSDTAQKYYRTKKERAQQVAVKKRISALEELIQAAEEEIAQKELFIASPEVCADYELLQQSCHQLEEMKEQLSVYTDEWLLLCEENE